MQMRRQFSGGLQFNFYYRYSKSIDQLSSEGPGAQTNQTDPARPQNEHGPSDFDTKHYVSVFGLWDLPVFRTRADWIGRGFGGWQIQRGLSAQKSRPLDPRDCRLQPLGTTNYDNLQ